jgi:hypothetical protein
MPSGSYLRVLSDKPDGRVRAERGLKTSRGHTWNHSKVVQNSYRNLLGVIWGIIKDHLRGARALADGLKQDRVDVGETLVCFIEECSRIQESVQGFYRGSE